MRGRVLMALACGLVATTASWADPPAKVEVVESATRTVERRAIMPSRDPERPCLVLEPVGVLTLHPAPYTTNFWEIAVCQARLTATLRRWRDCFEALQTPFQMHLLLPAVEM